MTKGNAYRKHTFGKNAGASSASPLSFARLAARHARPHARLARLTLVKWYEFIILIGTIIYFINVGTMYQFFY